MFKIKSVPGLMWFLWLPLLFVIDQLSKRYVLQHISFGDIYPVIPGLQFIFARNHGIAFSLLSQRGSFMQMGLLCFIILICLTIAWMLAKTPTHEKWSGFSLVFILGGAIGNLYDRFSHGYVIDFIDCYIGSWHWYTFNLADSFITIGALMLIKTILFSSTSAPSPSSSSSSPQR